MRVHSALLLVHMTTAQLAAWENGQWAGLTTAHLPVQQALTWTLSQQHACNVLLVTSALWAPFLARLAWLAPKATTAAVAVMLVLPVNRVSGLSMLLITALPPAVVGHT